MVYMHGVPTIFKCNSMSVMKTIFCVGEMKKEKRTEMSVISNGVTKYPDFGLHRVVKCSNFITLERVKV